MPRATHIRRRGRRGRHAAPASPSGAGAPGLPPAAPGPAAPPPPSGAPGPADAPVLLAWARDRDGRRVHVGSLDPSHRRERGPFACPGCAEEVVPRLGPVRARHFAHRPGSACPLTRPESALHLDAKERLLSLCADAFARRLTVSLAARCPTCRRPAPIDLGSAGDAAVGEGGAGTRRADVLVTRAGEPALALEVLVTHALEPEKEAALAALGLPALEIDAREPWQQEVAGGVEVRVARTLGTAPCPSCLAAARADLDRRAGGEAAALAELEAYRARGLLGPPPGPPLEAPPALDAGDREHLRAAFRCPECGQASLEVGERVARHRCAGTARPVAWRGYDGQLVELAWWRPRR